MKRELITRMEKPVLNAHTGMEEIDLRQDKNANGLVQLL
jgi:hypothetical protein